MENNTQQLVIQRLVQQGLCEETVEQLVSCLSNNPAYFLHRYGFFISETERESLFGTLAKQDWLVRTELWRLRKQRGESSQNNVVRNRRLAALEKLASSEQYFSDEQMELRDPLLYYRLWGRYASHLKTCELEQIRNNDNALFQMYPSRVSSSTNSEQKGITTNVGRVTEEEEEEEEYVRRPLTNYLMEYFGAKDIVERRMQQRRKERCHSVSSAKRMALPSTFGQCSSETEYIQEQLMEQASDEENEKYISSWTLEDFQQSREELLVIMRQRYLNGEDAAFFDYSTVDNNEQYDWMDWIENDREEKYFDGQEPERISSTMEQVNNFPEE